jgi:hypothetical protein
MVERRAAGLSADAVSDVRDAWRCDRLDLLEPRLRVTHIVEQPRPLPRSTGTIVMLSRNVLIACSYRSLAVVVGVGPAARATSTATSTS